MKLDHPVDVLGGYSARRAGCPLTRTGERHDVPIRDPMDPLTLVGDVFVAVGAESDIQGCRARRRGAGEPCPRCR